MCTVSMVMDHYRERWEPFIVPYIPWPQPQPEPVPFTEEAHRKLMKALLPPTDPITKEEIEEFRKLLVRAREYDARNGEPDCELDEKKQALIAIVKQLHGDLAAFLSALEPPTAVDAVDPHV